MEEGKQIRIVITSILVVAVIVGLGVFYFSNDSEKITSKNIYEETTTSDKVVVDTQLNKIDTRVKKEKITEVLVVLYNLYFVSLDKPQDSNTVSSFLFEEMKETMDDINSLKSLLYKTEQLQKSDDLNISTSGLVLHLTTKALIETFNSWVEYLRSVDPDNVNIPEYQYQYATLQSNTKNLYMELVKGMSLFPTIVIEFSKDENQENTVDAETRDYFILEIDRLFGDAFIDDDLFYQQTQTRNAVIVLVRNYKEFLTGEAY